MRKVSVGAMFLLASLSFADSYDYREQLELKCSNKSGGKSYGSNQADVNIVVQRETYVGFRGVENNLVKASVAVRGRIDGQNIQFEKKIKIDVDTKERLAIKPTFSVTNTQGVEITTEHLSDLTHDETTPGTSTKITISGKVANYRGNVILNLIESSGVGFISLNVESKRFTDLEHFATIPVQCSEIRDTADSGQKYYQKFENL